MSALLVSAPSRVRVGPAPALGIFVGYLLLVVGLARLIAPGVKCTEVTASADNVLKAVLLPIGIVSVLLTVAVTALGWWRPVMSEPKTLAGGPWSYRSSRSSL
ncbi:hypothetical protein AB0K43_07475 [Kitasatospora sp. NPDC049258]|uniref:hypothetical protein n=1 Tax=Kitasatospora sp. NPDC049258 TaxID=3155394 RepID=UPI0034349EE0